MISRCNAVVMSAVLVMALQACAAEGNGMTDPPSPPQPPPPGSSFSQNVQPIFTDNCAFSACHAGSDPQQGMNLSAGQAFSNIVNVPSNEVPRLLRIQPNNPDSSYLVLKIEGLAGGVGGVGTRMPLGGQLTQEQIDTIRAWVEAGAQNN